MEPRGAGCSGERSLRAALRARVAAYGAFDDFNAALRYYPYVDHRVLLSLRVGDGGNPWRARTAEDPGRVALPYRDPGERSILWDDPMRHLLRQEEDLAADCGCEVP